MPLVPSVPAGLQSKSILMAGALIAATSDTGLIKDALATIQATIVGTGAVTATVIVEYSNDLVAWVTGSTLSLTGTTIDSKGCVCPGNYIYAQARLTAITGTGAAVTVTLAG